MGMHVQLGSRPTATTNLTVTSLAGAAQETCLRSTRLPLSKTWPETLSEWETFGPPSLTALLLLQFPARNRARSRGCVSSSMPARESTDQARLRCAATLLRPAGLPGTGRGNPCPERQDRPPRRHRFGNDADAASPDPRTRPRATRSFHPPCRSRPRTRRDRDVLLGVLGIIRLVPRQELWRHAARASRSLDVASPQTTSSTRSGK